ncbi:MAG: dihydroorotate dehydrogenase [Candidatus Saganbacteria bacterium]|nr:dihydroorotate dehydrogenase [Candidatus Saganbacteria bacterium]
MGKLAVEIAGIKMKNPVMVASGTFGYGKEFEPFLDLNKLGAIITKTITLNPREGNPPPRICETPSGMLNTIGLQNKGVKNFIQEVLPFFAKLNTPLIANIAGETMDEYVEVAKILTREAVVKGLELNISCPNVKKGGVAFGVNPTITEELVKKVRKATHLPLIVKLTPNVTDIVIMAEAAVAGGADAVSLINTILGMAIDINTKKPKLSMTVGGLSGPAIKPVAVRMVWQVAQVVKVPVIGIGGITTWEDAAEFMLAGAKAVQVGTANLINPDSVIQVIEGLENYYK